MTAHAVPGMPFARHWDQWPHTEQRVFSYASQPTDNVDAWSIGKACSAAAKNPGGDYIDSGLELLKQLQELGYGVVRLPLNGSGGSNG